MRRTPIFVLAISIVAAMMTACTGESQNAASVKPSSSLSAAILPAPEGSNGHIKGVTAINEVFADGQKTSAVAVEFDKDIANSKLSKSAFSVEEKTITKLYTNTEAAKAQQGVDGKYVIIELSTDYENPVAIVQNTGGDQTNTNHKQAPPSGQNTNQNQSSSGNDPITPEDIEMHPGTLMSVNHGGDGLSISVKQVGNVETTDGAIYAPSPTAMENEKDINLIVDDFLKPDFNDPQNGQKLKFNIYVPKNYDKNKAYPLVLFIQDENSLGKHADPLIQGLGGVVWADPSEQVKHESFVLVPSYHASIVNDSFETTQDLDNTIDLINTLETKYNIDRNRIYLTGQSMGANAAFAFNVKYPKMFAATLLVSGQWDQKVMPELVHANMWIVNTEGDEKTYSGMNADIASLEAAGAKISRPIWNGQASTEDLDAGVSKVVAEGNNIKYTVLQKGTVVPSDQSDTVENNHAYTWRIAYSIEGLRDWLFKQVKP